MRMPTNTKVTQTAAQHGYAATDYSFQPDEWVYAIENGVIQSTSLSAGQCGKQIVLRGNNTGALYYMCHFRDIGVKQGQAVAEGQRLGIMGDTGYAIGRHLHIYIIHNGVRVPDPDVWLRARVTPPKPPTTGGNNLMTDNFIITTYQKIAGRQPSPAEIAFHKAKSTPESFVGGFQDNDIMWKKLKVKIDNAKKALV